MVSLSKGVFSDTCFLRARRREEGRDLVPVSSTIYANTPQALVAGGVQNQSALICFYANLGATQPHTDANITDMNKHTSALPSCSP